MLLFIVIVIFIFCIPIPIKFSFNYDNGKIQAFLYKINLNKIINKKYNIKNVSKKNFENKEKASYVYLKNTYGYIHEVFKYFIFKPKLSFKINLNYGLGDAAYTAILYGLLNSLYPVVYKTISNFFKVHSLIFNIKPNLQNKMLKVNIISIFYINLAKLIYMIIITFVKFHSNKKINHANNIRKEG